MINKAHYYFPNGCNYCGSEVEFKDIGREGKGHLVYICSKCGAFTGIHKNDSEFNVKDSPLGMLADKELRSIKYMLADTFNRLWSGGDINKVYTDYIVLYKNEPHIMLSKKTTTDYVLEGFNGEIIKPTERFTTVDNRTKAYFWLNRYMGKDNPRFALGYYNKEESLKALDYINSKKYEFHIV